MNRGEMRTRLLAALGETGAYLSRFADEELNLYLDDAYMDIAEKTGVVTRTVVLDVPADQHFVTLPDDCLYPLAVRDENDSSPIDPTTWVWIDGIDRLWIRRSRSRPWVFSSWGMKEILIYPAYNVAGQINMQMAVIPQPFTSDADVPDIPEDYHQALVYYANYQALIKDADGPRLGRALRQLQYYMEMVSDVGDYANSRHEGIRTSIYGNSLRNPARMEMG